MPMAHGGKARTPRIAAQQRGRRESYHTCHTLAPCNCRKVTRGYAPMQRRATVSAAVATCGNHRRGCISYITNSIQKAIQCRLTGKGSVAAAVSPVTPPASPYCSKWCGLYQTRHKVRSAQRRKVMWRAMGARTKIMDPGPPARDSVLSLPAPTVVVLFWAFACPFAQYRRQSRAMIRHSDTKSRTH